MKTVWKEVLPRAGGFVVKMPKNSDILHVGTQRGNLCMWFLCNPDAELEYRAFAALMTGEETDMVLGDHIGTVAISDLIVHIFEVLR